MQYVTVLKIIKKYPQIVPLLQREEEPVLCVHTDSGKKKQLSFRALHDNNRKFYASPTSSWQFYIPAHRVHRLLAELRENQEEHYFQYDTDDFADTAAKERNGDSNFGSRYKAIQLLNEKEKIDTIREHTFKLNQLLTADSRDNEETTTALAESTEDASMVNKSFIEQALKMGNEEAKVFSQELVDRTHEMVKTSTSLIDQSVLQDEMLDSLVNKSNGTVVQHMTRTYLRSVSFLLYYNKMILNSSLPNRIRIQFKKKYKKYYKRLLSHLHQDDIVLERVFYSGMQAISPQQVNIFATGFLLHDVGKAKDIEYHEGNQDYDREKVIDHVRQGYIAVVNKTNYPMDVSMITGYHHEYYGDPSGYGFFRAQLNQFLKQNPKHHMDYLIGYSTQAVSSFKTMAFFPAKILEILDVFDALTDPNRQYREPLQSEEALSLMQEQFIDSNLKLDPILFDMFQEYQLQSAS